VRLALRLSVVLLPFFLPFLFLSLVIIIIGTLCYKMTRLTTFEAGVFSLLFTLVGIFLASPQCGFEALDHKRHILLVESGSLCATLLGSASLLLVALRAMCLVRECSAGLSAKRIALSLSHRSGTLLRL
jgi:hypothetical protein